MRSMSSLVHKLKVTHPTIAFVEADQFSWSPSQQTVFYNHHQPQAAQLLLHELSHALLGHRNYYRDVELVAMESRAWEEARRYAEMYNVRIQSAVIQDHLDTYRDWLHARSLCPACSANGYQIQTSEYECPACFQRWRVNDARLCALRRYQLA